MNSNEANNLHSQACAARFKEGFFKRAAESGLTKEQAAGLIKAIESDGRFEIVEPKDSSIPLERKPRP